MIKITINSFYGIRLLINYIFKVFPLSKKQKWYWREALKESMNEEDLSTLLSICFNTYDSLIYYLYSLYPNADIKITTNFISSFCMLANYLENICIQHRIKDETTLRQLYLSMLDAVDTCRKISSYCKYFPHKSVEKHLQLFVKSCRNQLAELPSYHVILEYIKKYVYLYSDLNIYKFISDDKSRDEYLLTWAGYYINQYPLITSWEFSASTNSFLSILSLFSSAFDPSLDVNKVKAIDSIYFPWICGLNILLKDYLNYHHQILEDTLSKSTNFTHYYRNLKECEERIDFFINNAFVTCSQLDYPIFHLSIIKWLLAIFLSHPKARFGLKRIASYNILKNRGKSYCRLCRLLGVFSCTGDSYDVK